jgi:uncharacterized protein (TIGR02246 family)
MPKAVIAAVLACSAVAGAADAAPPDEAAIRSNVAAYETAWNKRDVAGVLATYTPDADIVAFDGPRTAGREAMRARLREDFAASPPTMRISLTVTGIRPLTPESAIVDTVARFNEGGVRENRGSSVFVRRDGKWLVSALRVFPAQRP